MDCKDESITVVKVVEASKILKEEINLYAILSVTLLLK